MSFSKAKLLRFNEIAPSTPSPADYTILSNSHVAGAALSKSDRFLENASPAVSDTSSHHSSSNLPVFRTPNPPKRRKPKQKNAEGIAKPIELFQSEDSLDALKEKIVECNNKDQYINELMEQVGELKHQLNGCNNQLLELSQENTRLTETLTHLNNDKQTLINDQHERLMNVNEKVITVCNTHNKIHNAKPISCGNKEDLKTLLENIEILDDLLESYKVINDRNYTKLQEKDKQLSDLEDDYIDFQKKHSDEIANIQEGYEKQIENMRLTQNQIETDYLNQLKIKSDFVEVTENRIYKLQEDFKSEKQTLIEENEAKVQQAVNNFNEASMLAEIQFEQKRKEIDSCWILKLETSKHESDAILKECQAIAEYNIIQSELEKNQILYDLNEQKDHSKILQEDYNKLKEEFDVLTNEYKNLFDNFEGVKKSQTHTQTELKVCTTIIEEMKKEKHKYEVTIMKTHALIDTLKNRLINSDKDVEQLKTELEDTEVSKLEYESKCNELEEELRTVLQLFDTVTKEIKTVKKENMERTETIEKELLLKVDVFKKEADSKIAKLNVELEKSKQQLDETLQLLAEQQNINIKAHDVIENALKDMDNLKNCAKCSQLQEQLKELEKQNENMSIKILQQELLIGPFRDQLTQYEIEHRALTSQKFSAEQEAKEMGLKYAQLLGHQNQKQKIHHLIDLKKKNYELTENVKDLEAKIRQQSRTIEKMKKDICTATKVTKKKIIEDKENILNNSIKHIIK